MISWFAASLFVFKEEEGRVGMNVVLFSRELDFFVVFVVVGYH